MTYLGLPHVVQHSFDHGEENPPVKEESCKNPCSRGPIEKSAVKREAKSGKHSLEKRAGKCFARNPGIQYIKKSRENAGRKSRKEDKKIASMVRLPEEKICIGP